MVMTPAEPTIGDTKPCPTCNHVKNPAKRLHEIACCGLESHFVGAQFSIHSLTYQWAHLWRDENTYSAIQSHHQISEVDALAWLERAHAGEVERRPYHDGLTLDFDWWED